MMPVPRETRLSQLRAEMTDVPLWLAVSRGTGADPRPLLLEHLEYLRELQHRGALFASGPTAEDRGKPAFGGATILRAADIAEAHRIMSEEPYVRAGERTYELIAWSLRQGDVDPA